MSYISSSLTAEVAPEVLPVAFAVDRAGCIVRMREGVLRFRNVGSLGSEVVDTT
ncbi:hypothetical protein IF1G_01342 [Cordyceps javanica]|uniref:Uncharacterized protein n=1 Tax=Cordyceps javanica TaxID=43265 RepID=A0A545VBL7_9HYPO|nr:hypothetical protein IF1G_01342 [Cordyceps javanica]